MAIQSMTATATPLDDRLRHWIDWLTATNLKVGMASETYKAIYDGRTFPSMAGYDQTTNASTLFDCLSAHAWAISTRSYKGGCPLRRRQCVERHWR